MARLEAFVQRVEAICGVSGDKALQKWLDNQKVCEISDAFILYASYYTAEIATF